MTSPSVDFWISRLGFDKPDALTRQGARRNSGHPYGHEIDALLDPGGLVQAEAVFEVEGVPTVCFLDATTSDGAAGFEAIRRSIWNQNLISIMLVVDGFDAKVYPVTAKGACIMLGLDDPAQSAEFDAAAVQSNNVFRNHAEWFKPEDRADAFLLRNLSTTVRVLHNLHGLDMKGAQELLGQILFISYLEDRGIVSDVYRRVKKVSQLKKLIEAKDRKGILELIELLKHDFNGDFLAEYGEDADQNWNRLSDDGFEFIQHFLTGEDMSSGQQRLWGYDFSFLPVELISGIYESFLDSSKVEIGAYYTPRHLANLVVDEALAGVAHPELERIYDGACGSGILLTTAFRRILSHLEDRRGELLALSDRIALLRSTIFGSDISPIACRITAFSLYLSLLERLRPTDLAALEKGEGVKLPQLRGLNLLGGVEGDFFAKKNHLASRTNFTLYLSNPPWGEGRAGSSAETWAEGKVSSVRRQIAAHFAHKAAGCVAGVAGRVCLILPVSLFLAPTSQPFVREWLSRVRVSKLLNLGDLRDVLFDQAHHACVVVVAKSRAHVSGSGADDSQLAAGSELRPGPVVIGPEEEFQYWVPKSDASLAFGRISLRGEDRHSVQSHRVMANNQILVTLWWGNYADLALCARLRIRGRLGDFAKNRWTIRKGVHLRDVNSEAQSSEPLRAFSFIPITALHGDFPVIDPQLLAEFPEHQLTVVGLNDALLSVFDGPRVVLPDGPSNILQVRAHYISQRASFTSSVGVIAAPAEDAALIKFLTLYLRSKLVSYFVVLSQYSVLCAQKRISLKDIQQLPFVSPEDHSDPVQANEIVGKLAQHLDDFLKNEIFDRMKADTSRQHEIDHLIYDYFGLSEEERNLVEETVSDVIPSIQPRAFSSLLTDLQREASRTQMEKYAQSLVKELTRWKDQSNGAGSVLVSVWYSGKDFNLGVVEISVSDKLTQAGRGSERPTVREGVEATLRMLIDKELLPLRVSQNLYLAADVVIVSELNLYIVKPLLTRAWLSRTAIEDASRIVQEVRKAAAVDADGNARAA